MSFVADRLAAMSDDYRALCLSHLVSVRIHHTLAFLAIPDDEVDVERDTLQPIGSCALYGPYMVVPVDRRRMGDRARVARRALDRTSRVPAAHAGHARRRRIDARRAGSPPAAADRRCARARACPRESRLRHGDRGERISRVRRDGAHRRARRTVRVRRGDASDILPPSARVRRVRQTPETTTKHDEPPQRTDRRPSNKCSSCARRWNAKRY